MSSPNRKSCQLGDVVSFQRGYDLPISELEQGPYPVVGSNGIIGWHNKSTNAGPSLTVGRSGNSSGRVFFYDGPSWSHNTTLYVKDFHGNHPRFVYYFLKSLRLDQHSGGSAVPTLNRNHIKTLEVDVPDYSTQVQIASVLGSLDDAATLIIKTNDYLEQCLLARYDHLFGHAGSYDGTISDIGDVVGGATPSKKRPEYYCHDGIGWITPRDLSNTSDKFIAHGADDITQMGFESCSVKKLPAGAVLFSSRAPIGYIAIATDEVTTNQGFKSVVPRPGIGTAFVYCFLARNKDRIADAGSGTTFPEVSGKTMAGIELSLPDIELCVEFEKWG